MNLVFGPKTRYSNSTTHLHSIQRLAYSPLELTRPQLLVAFTDEPNYLRNFFVALFELPGLDFLA